LREITASEANILFVSVKNLVKYLSGSNETFVRLRHWSKASLKPLNVKRRNSPWRMGFSKSLCMCCNPAHNIRSGFWIWILFACCWDPQCPYVAMVSLCFFLIERSKDICQKLCFFFYFSCKLQKLNCID